MSDEPAKLSNPFSTGGGGYNFENNVQSAFVVLMLSGGVVPCLPGLPIKQIILQGKYAGYDTDDFIVFVGSQDGKKRAKLLTQIKHSISFTKNNSVFKEVMQSAWSDFQNNKIFDHETDAIALITGPLAEALNVKEADDMRSGFTCEFFNQRGVHGFSAGEEERKFAAGFNAKADALEEKGYQRIATAVRELAKGYERDAEREAKRNPYGE
jgi:hypothetical protein